MMNKVDRAKRTLEAVDGRLEQIRRSIAAARSIIDDSPDWITSNVPKPSGPIIIDPPPPPPEIGECLKFVEFRGIGDPVAFDGVLDRLRRIFSNLADVIVELDQKMKSQPDSPPDEPTA